MKHAIELLKEAIATKKRELNSGEINKVPGLKQVFESVLSEMESELQQLEGMGWISVETKMPANRQKVIIYYTYQGTNFVGCGHYAGESKHPYWASGQATQLNVTHWQPLPTPPINPETK